MYCLKRYFRLLFGTNILMLSSCATPAVRTMHIFGDTLPFKAVSPNRDVFIYRNPSLKATSYSKFLIDPVMIDSEPKAESRGIQSKAKDQLSEGFRNELIKALQDRYPIVDKPGPDVLRIRAAIQEFQPATWEFDEEKFMVMKFDTIVESAVMELDCLDSVSGERVVSLIRMLEGRQYVRKEKLARLQNIQEAFGDWARVLRKRFDAARAQSDLLIKLRNDETSPFNTEPASNNDLKREEGD